MTTSKKGKLKLVVIVFLCTIAGGAVGGYASFAFMKEFFLYGFYSSEVAKTTVELSALRSLRSGDIGNAIKLLELNVWGSSLTLEGSENEAPKAARQNIDEALSSIRKYETDFGIKLGSGVEVKD